MTDYVALCQAMVESVFGEDALDDDYIVYISYRLQFCLNCNNKESIISLFENVQTVLITALKRSLGQGNIFAPVYHSVHVKTTVFSLFLFFYRLP